MTATVLELPVAEDLMNRDVVSIGPRETIQDAILRMSEHHVSGLPVVGDGDRCVGVISASDILSFVENEQEDSEGTVQTSGRYFNTESGHWESIALSPALMEEYGSTPVEDVMTSTVITVPPHMSAAQVALEMEENSVHRVLVVDQEQKLKGVISAFDFVVLAAAAARD